MAPDSACLNESPSEKEGKSLHVLATAQDWVSLNESPSEKEGKFAARYFGLRRILGRLNESPSEKEGKCGMFLLLRRGAYGPQ